MVALLDQNASNPWSRLPNSNYRTIERARRFVGSGLRSQAAYRDQSLRLRRNSAPGSLAAGSAFSAAQARKRGSSSIAKNVSKNGNGTNTPFYAFGGRTPRWSVSVDGQTKVTSSNGSGSGRPPIPPPRHGQGEQQRAPLPRNSKIVPPMVSSSGTNTSANVIGSGGSSRPKLVLQPNGRGSRRSSVA